MLLYPSLVEAAVGAEDGGWERREGRGGGGEPDGEEGKGAGRQKTLPGGAVGAVSANTRDNPSLVVAPTDCSDPCSLSGGRGSAVCSHYEPAAKVPSSLEADGRQRGVA